MENYQYEPIKPYTEEKIEKSKPYWIYFLRQLIICSGGWTFLLINGLALGAPTVMIAQLKKDPKFKDQLTTDMSSWLTCTVLYCSPFWCFSLSPLANRIGRRITLASANVLLLSGFIVYYFSNTLNQIFVSEFLKSVGGGASMSVLIYIMSEYPSSKYRGLFLTLKTASIMWGTWVANAIGTFFHWKYISIVAFICFLYPATSVFFWPESPIWLAQKGRFEECVKSHRWLKGIDEDTEKELRRLIETEKEKLGIVPEHISCRTRLSNLAKTVTKKEFYKPLIIALLVLLTYVLSAKMVCVMYAMEILHKITNDEAKAYVLMLILDGFTVFGMYCGCITARYVKRRSLLINTSIVANIFLGLFTLYLYLIYLQLFDEIAGVSITLLSLYSLSIALGPLIMCFSAFGELMPVDHRTSFTIIGILFNFLTAGTYMKLAPLIFNAVQLHTAFFIYTTVSVIITVLVYFFYPETKDKTLAEISDIFKDKKEVKERQEVEA